MLQMALGNSAMLSEQLLDEKSANVGEKTVEEEKKAKVKSNQELGSCKRKWCGAYGTLFAEAATRGKENCRTWNNKKQHKKGMLLVCEVLLSQLARVG
jgi:hypothetical protein